MWSLLARLTLVSESLCLLGSNPPTHTPPAQGGSQPVQPQLPSRGRMSLDQPSLP